MVENLFQHISCPCFLTKALLITVFYFTDDLTSIRHNGKMNRQWSLAGLYSNLLQYLLIPRAQASLFILLSLSFLICYMQIALVKANTAHSIILIANESWTEPEGVPGQRTDDHTPEQASYAFSLSLPLFTVELFHPSLLLHEVVRQGCIRIQTCWLQK